jgi:hypothetical protein
MEPSLVIPNHFVTFLVLQLVPPVRPYLHGCDPEWTFAGEGD